MQMWIKELGADFLLLDAPFVDLTEWLLVGWKGCRHEDKSSLPVFHFETATSIWRREGAQKRPTGKYLN